jgi:endonuclease YncB( thermonuclease family)
VRLDARSLARAPDGVADALAAAEAEARSARAGVWEYGDPGSDGDE